MSQHLHKPPPLEKLQNLPECVRAAVGHMIEKDPAKRPQTPSLLRAELENCLTAIASAPANEQDFRTMVEAPMPSAELHPPPLPAQVPQPKSSSRGVMWMLVVLALGLVAAGAFFYWKTRAPVTVTSAASPSPTASITSTAAAPIAQATPVAASPSPALTRDALAEAEKLEAAGDWPRAIMAYVELQKKFPENDVGRVRLELMLSKLQSDKEGLRDEDFDALRGPLTEAAKLEVVSAMEILGELLRKRDPKASFQWLSAAAAHGRAHAMAEVGLRYSNGAGVERDLVKAVEWFDKARGAGDVSARTLLAECYLFGKGVTKNESKAIALLQDAAAANDPRAMDQLATCYHKAIGVKRDGREAFRLYSAAAKLGYLDSTGNLGVLYLTSDETDLGKNQTARTEKAVDLFREGAKQENAFCMFLYARCFELGTGVSANASEASDWYRRAAEAGNRPAQEWCRQHQVNFATE
jgi:TPR repeat protein